MAIFYSPYTFLSNTQLFSSIQNNISIPNLGLSLLYFILVFSFRKHKKPFSSGDKKTLIVRILCTCACVHIYIKLHEHRGFCPNQSPGIMRLALDIAVSIPFLHSWIIRNSKVRALGQRFLELFGKKKKKGREWSTEFPPSFWIKSYTRTMLVSDESREVLALVPLCGSQIASFGWHRYLF